MRPLGAVLHAAALSLALAAPAALAQKNSERDDARAIQGMIQANLAEVEAGKLASQKAQKPEVKKFAEKMVEDHGKKLDDLKSLADKKGVAAPDKLSGKHQAMLKKLQTASDDQFDRVYMSEMVQAHKQVLQDTRKVAREAKDPDLKAAAQKSAPGTEEHLKMAREIAGEKAAGPKKAATPK
jgi:putative membrane protein